ncbi:MAG: 30S ribosomal protein S20 [Gemmataceae bacterium]|nr:30S ribosomal protein S20 [Gemmataceae bacterium]MDW8242767.1 30S ribosomal protein S20 [Thermogemmata sp.]
MPHTQSAWKRMRQNERRRRRNRAWYKRIKKQRRATIEAITTSDPKQIQEQWRLTQQLLDRAADKGYIHPNKAARLKSRLIKKIRAAQAQKTSQA